jgi:hypothetical protein
MPNNNITFGVDLLPQIPSTYDLGNNTYKWNNIYATNIFGNLQVATTSAIGGLKLGYTTSHPNYALAIDSNGQAYTNVPWINTYHISGTWNGLKYTASCNSEDAADELSFTIPTGTSSS